MANGASGNAGAQARLLFLAAIWGASFLFTRVGAPSFGAVPLILLRTGFAALLIMPIVIARGQWGTTKKRILGLTALGVINSGAPFLLFALSVPHLGAGTGSILNATAPLWGALLGYFVLGQRLGPRKILGLAVGFLGVALLVRERSQATASAAAGAFSALHVVEALGATFLYGVGALYSKRSFSDLSPLVITGGSQLGAALTLVPAALFLWPSGPVPIEAWGSAVGVGVLCTGVAYLIYFRMLEEGGPAHALAVTYLIPVFGLLWGNLFLGEVVTWGMGAASLVVLAGTVLSTWNTHAPQTTKPAREARAGGSHVKGERGPAP